MSESIVEALRSVHDPTLVAELLAAYDEAKRNFYTGGHRLSAVEGGRFCEAAYRILQNTTTGAFTPLGEVLDTEGVSRRLSSLPSAAYPESVRLHIPRALRVVYDIRNTRDAAHLADGINSNLQDSVLVVSVLDWVLAEFVRLSGALPVDVALRLVEGLVTRRLPIIQDFDGFPKVLRPELRASELLLVLLYHAAPKGASKSDLVSWSPAPMKSNLSRTLRVLEEKALVHRTEEAVFITYAGQKVVEGKRLMESV